MAESAFLLPVLLPGLIRQRVYDAFRILKCIFNSDDGNDPPPAENMMMSQRPLTSDKFVFEWNFCRF